MKKVKNENDATFLDMYDVFASQNGHFSHLTENLKVNHAFKAKKETFRERNSQKVKNGSILLHLTLRFLDRDENHFFTSPSPKPCANQRFLLHFAIADFFNPNRDFTFSLLVKDLMEFQ